MPLTLPGNHNNPSKTLCSAAPSSAATPTHCPLPGSCRGNSIVSCPRPASAASAKQQSPNPPDCHSRESPNPLFQLYYPLRQRSETAESHKTPSTTEPVYNIEFIWADQKRPAEHRPSPKNKSVFMLRLPAPAPIIHDLSSIIRPIKPIVASIFQGPRCSLRRRFGVAKGVCLAGLAAAAVFRAILVCTTVKKAVLGDCLKNCS